MASRFQETRWTLVLAAAGDSNRGRQALGELCEQYWSPLFAFARARGLTPEDAQDATQGFFEQLIARGDLALADPARGRFRAFLLVAFKHFMANERDRARTLKRGGGQTFVPLDAVDRPIEPAHHETPESLYERAWARTLLARAVDRLRAEAGTDGAPLVAHLAGLMTGDGADVPMKSLADTLGTSEGAARVALHRMRQKLRRRIVDEIAQTVGPGEDVEDELRHVLASLA
jgi:DNA-directed RNA polymerase specialized sigma24 family protein